MTNINACLDLADAANRYETIRDRRDAARARETWCDACREWVEKRAMAQHLAGDAHAAADAKANAWRM